MTTTPETGTEPANAELLAFLNARLDEDERHLKSNAHHLWTKRPLREVAAKRAVIAMHDELWRLYRTFEQAGEPGPISLGRAQGLWRAVRLVGAVYSDHPDYRPEWKPVALTPGNPAA